MKILIGENNRICAKGNNVEQYGTGWKVDGVRFAFGEVVEIDDSIEVIIGKHQYVNGEISVLLSYESEIELVKEATIDTYTLELIESGLI